MCLCWPCTFSCSLHVLLSFCTVFIDLQFMYLYHYSCYYVVPVDEPASSLLPVCMYFIIVPLYSYLFAFVPYIPWWWCTIHCMLYLPIIYITYGVWEAPYDIVAVIRQPSSFHCTATIRRYWFRLHFCNWHCLLFCTRAAVACYRLPLPPPPPTPQAIVCYRRAAAWRTADYLYERWLCWKVVFCWTFASRDILHDIPYVPVLGHWWFGIPTFYTCPYSYYPLQRTAFKTIAMAWQAFCASIVRRRGFCSPGRYDLV